MALFKSVDDNPEHPYIALTLEKDPAQTQDEALIEFYKRLRPGDPPTVENARALVTSLFFNFRRYDLGRVGRYKLNKALGDAARKLKIELPVEGGEHPREPRPQQARHRRDRPQADRSSTTSAVSRTTSTTWATAASARSAS